MTRSIPGIARHLQFRAAKYRSLAGLGISGAALLLAAGPAAAQTDITFFATSDVHFGQSSATKDANRAAMTNHLNTLAGKAYPASAGGGPVGVPRGVLIPGDLIENSTAILWSNYIADYGLNKEGRLKHMVYDGLGNHEFYGSGFGTISANLMKRNKDRKANAAFKIAELDTNNLHYSWDWDGVHFVNLNVFGGVVKSFQNGTPNAFGSLDFLKRDLAKHVGNSGRPVLAMQHYPFEANDTWMPASDRAAVIAELKKYNCIGILHGHTHARKIYKYDGIDIYDDGTTMNGDHLVFRISGGKLLVMNRINDAWGSLKFEKAISMGNPTGTSRDPALMPSRGGQFSFSVEGVGGLYTGIVNPTAVEIRDLSGRLVRALSPSGRDLSWDRRDATGNAVPRGLYLVSIRAAAATVRTKVTL